MTVSREYLEVLKACVGQRGEPHMAEVEKATVRKFARAIGEQSPLYFDEAYARTTRFGSIIAPLTFVAALKAPGLPPLPLPPEPFGVFLHTDDVIEQYEPIRVGDVITSAAELTGVFVRTGRAGDMLFTTFTYSMTNQDRRHVATLAWTEVQY